MHRAVGHAVGVVSCVLVAGCGGAAAVAAPPLAWAAPETSPSALQHAPWDVARGTRDTAIREAHDEAVALVTSAEFVYALHSLPALAVRADANAATDVSGTTVATTVFGQSRPIAYRTAWRPDGVTASTALTMHAGSEGATVTLFTATTKRLRDRGHGASACVVNTLVHEWTHSARNGGDYAYEDDDHDSSPRPLVSYTVGAVAQCVYLVRHYRVHDPTATFALDRCVAAVGVRAFDPRSCVDDWGRQFITAREGMLW